MDAKPLPLRPNLEHYKELAKTLLQAYKAGDAKAMRRMQEHYQRSMTWDELREESRRQLCKHKNTKIQDTRVSLADAQFLIARAYAFESWPKFKKHIEASLRLSSSVSKFESAADAIITGDITTLERLLREDPGLIRACSTRTHHSTLLHYVSANGLENFRQKTPKNIVAITKVLLEAGAEADAANDDYGGGGTALGLVATSIHPAWAGVQIALMETLLEGGASPDGRPGGWNPLTAALGNGRGDAAAFLATRGAKLDLEGAAGVGRLDVVQSFFHQDGSLREGATRKQMLSGLAWACQYGRTDVVEFLLQTGIDVGAKLSQHGEETGLHQAAYGGHVDIVKLLLERKAPVDVRDKRFNGTPLGWALHGWQYPPPEVKHQDSYYEVVALLVAAGARVKPELESDGKIRSDPRMLTTLKGKS